MASTISAGTSAGTAIAIAGDTSGNLAFQTSAGTYTQTMPNVTGTVMVSGNQPTFSAYVGSNQTIATGVTAKVQYSTKIWDTASAYDSTTNYRFTPLVAGYYQVNACIGWNSIANGECYLSIYKNGSEYKRGFDSANGSVAAPFGSQANGLVYCNGSTDYIEMYAYNGTAGNRTIGAYNTVSTFDACLVRTA